MPAKFIHYGLWGLAPPLQGLIAGFMIWRKLHRDFPCFLAYTIFHVIKSAALFFVLRYGSYPQYFYSYWIGGLGSAVLGFLVIQELYSNVFRRYDGLKELGILLFRWAAIVLVIVAVLTASMERGTDADRLVAAVLVSERSFRIVQGGLLLFLFLLASYFGLKLRHYVFGIGLGLALFASVELVAVAVRAQVGEVAASTFSLVRAIAYNCAVVIWVFYIVAPEPQEKPLDILPRAELEKWNQALLGLLQR